MATLLIALGAGIGFIIAYHTYGRWLGSRIFGLDPNAVTPACQINDGSDYVPTSKAIVFGHHFTSIAGTGPIVGPAIAVMWGWLPALLWVVFGSIFIGAVHDLGSLVVSLRNNGQTVGDIAGRVLNRRVRLLFLFVLFMALTIVLAIFGLVIAAVFKQYPASIFPVWIQLPIAIGIGLWLHKKGVGLTIPSLIALALMYLTVIFGDQNFKVAEVAWLPAVLVTPIAEMERMLGGFNAWAAGFPTIVWVIILLVYSYIASVLPVWVLLQPRDYINSLQLISALGLIVVGLVAAAFIGGAPPVEGATRVPLEIVAPAWNFQPKDAPLIFPFLFITIACGAISGFHCLVSSGTSSKQLRKETDARFVGYGSMLTEGFLAVIVILACTAGLGLGVRGHIDEVHAWFSDEPGHRTFMHFVADGSHAAADLTAISPSALVYSSPASGDATALVGPDAWSLQYGSWKAAGGLPRTVGAFVDGSANFLKAIGVPGGVAVALMGVLVASFAGTTLDTACRLQRYVVQELAATFAPRVSPSACPACGYDLSFNVSGKCPECGAALSEAVRRAVGTLECGGNDAALAARGASAAPPQAKAVSRPPQSKMAATAATWHHASRLNPIVWLTNKHVATIFACTIAAAIAAMPGPGKDWSWQSAGTGGLILWPLFGATNQLLAGLAFLVIGFWLWRRNKPIWFLVLPMLFMLIMPLAALAMQIFWGDGSSKAWVNEGRWVLLVIGLATLALEVWMIVEAVLLLPRVRGVLETPPPVLATVEA
ncbi:MAG: carbon starvation protein A [Phycisphaeraceae bacterium]